MIYAGFPSFCVLRFGGLSNFLASSVVFLNLTRDQVTVMCLYPLGCMLMRAWTLGYRLDHVVLRQTVREMRSSQHLPDYKARCPVPGALSCRIQFCLSLTKKKDRVACKELS